MQVIVQHRKPADGDGENVCRFLQAMFDPLFAVVRSFPEQQIAAHAPRHAVIPTGHRGIDPVGASDGHRWIFWGALQMLPVAS